jgi:hypothetical protein
MMDSEGISQEQAAAALDTIEGCRELIRAERAEQRTPRFRSILLGAITPLIVYTSKDFVRSRVKRWALIVGWQAALFALTALLRNDPRVTSQLPMPRPQSSKRPVVMTVVALAGMSGAERLTVWSLRRSRLRRPNLVAGFVIAALRTVYRELLLERIMHAGQHAEPVRSGQLHPALLRPETLRLGALLGGGGLVDLSFLRETFGVDRLALAAILQPLVDAKLLTSITTRDSVKVLLKPEGRDAFAQHEHALRELSRPPAR